MNNSRLEFANYVSNKILSYQFKDEEIQEYSVILILLETGRRKSDLLNLKWNDINFEWMCIDNLVCRKDIFNNIPLSEKVCSLLNKTKSDKEFVFQQSAIFKADTLVKEILGYDRFSLMDLRGIMVHLLVNK